MTAETAEETAGLKRRLTTWGRRYLSIIDVWVGLPWSPSGPLQWNPRPGRSTSRRCPLSGVFQPRRSEAGFTASRCHSILAAWGCLSSLSCFRSINAWRGCDAYSTWGAVPCLDGPTTPDRWTRGRNTPTLWMMIGPKHWGGGLCRGFILPLPSAMRSRFRRNGNGPQKALVSPTAIQPETTPHARAW